MESHHLAVTGRPSEAVSPMLDPGAVDDVQLLRVETAADRTAAAKRAATALDDGESRQQARPSQAAAAHSIREERADHLAFAWVTQAERDAETESWKVTCRIQVPIELSQRRCHWQRADPPVAGQAVELVSGAARSGLGWARCKTTAIERIGLPWEEEFKGIKDGDHIFCIKVEDGLDISMGRDEVRVLQTQTMVLRPDQDACTSTDLATCWKGIPPSETAQPAKRRRGGAAGPARLTGVWDWRKLQCRVQGYDAAEIKANEPIRLAEQLQQQAALSKQEAPRRADYDRLALERDQKHENMMIDKARAEDAARAAAASKRAWQESELRVREAQKLLGEAEGATVWVAEYKRAERAKIAAEKEELQRTEREAKRKHDRMMESVEARKRQLVERERALAID